MWRSKNPRHDILQLLPGWEEGGRCCWKVYSLQYVLSQTLGLLQGTSSSWFSGPPKGDNSVSQANFTAPVFHCSGVYAGSFILCVLCIPSLLPPSVTCYLRCHSLSASAFSVSKFIFPSSSSPEIHNSHAQKNTCPHSGT